MDIPEYKPYKVPNIFDTQFFQSTTKTNRLFADKDLAKSGLTLEDVCGYADAMMKLPQGVGAGYGIPYFGLDGNPLMDAEGFLTMYRIRLKREEFSKEPRYTQPHKEQLALQNLPSSLPYFHPCTFSLEGDYIVCAEGEKKTVSILKYLGLPAFGIGGCQQWRNPDRSGSIHPWIVQLLQQRGIDRVLIVPDADLFRYDICNAYGTFAHALQNSGFTVEIVNPPGKIDDLICEWGDNAKSNFLALKKINPQELVQSPAYLAKRYNLAFKQDDKNGAIPYQHTSNVMRLMEEHDAFPKFWRNLDNNRVMVGEENAQPDLTEMDIANYFQHNLGFEKINHRIVYACIQALAKRHARSPWLDHVRAQSWDNTRRLSTWISDYWGVANSRYLQEISVKWLVASCARMDKPGTKIDWMFIVIGPQGVGKTSMPSILFRENARVIYGENNDKDLHMILHSSLCIGFDELDSFGRRETSTLKAMITRQEDAFRPPYGASVEIFPRRFILYGSGNRHEFLQGDPSGYRRYAIVEVQKLLNFSGLENVRDQLWAEAWHLYQQGGIKYWEIEGASEEAEKYVIDNPMEDQIRAFIERGMMDKQNTRIAEGYFWFTMGELMQHLGHDKIGANNQITKDVAGSLRAMGALKCDKPVRHPVTRALGKYYRLPLQ